MHWLDSVVFPEPFWVDVRGDRKASEPLELEVWRELRFTHPLGRIAGKVVASCPGTGEVVMTTRTGAAVVQLTWLGRKVDDGRPEWVEVGSADELLGELRSRPRMHWLDSLEFPARGWTDCATTPSAQPVWSGSCGSSSAGATHATAHSSRSSRVPGPTTTWS